MSHGNTSHRRAVRGRLMDRDYEILEHIRCYRMTTRDVLHRLFFADAKINAVSKVTRRLVQQDILRSHEMDGSTVYFTFGDRACRMFGDSKQRIKPLGPQALPTRFGTLLYCAARPSERQKLTVSEIAKSNPGYLAKGVDASQYYVERQPDSGMQRLGYIRVDQGGEPSHVARKSGTDVEKRMAVPLFRDLIQQQRFLIAIVTCSKARADQIKDVLRRRNIGALCRVEVCEQMLPIIANCRDS